MLRHADGRRGADDDLRKELVKPCAHEIGPIASPDKIQFAPGLPKTRSGKIMRRILRKIAEDDFDNLGDTSTLADPAVVDDLIENRQNKGQRIENGVRGYRCHAGEPRRAPSDQARDGLRPRGCRHR
jgi:hypothetical protein